MKGLGLAIAVVLLLATGCASRPLAFAHSPALPAAQPKARVSQDDNRNHRVEIEIEHMALAEHLSPPRAVYVVWVQGEEGRILPLGRLQVGEDRQARFQGVTGLDRFRILISAELDPQATAPSQPYMLVSEFVQQDP